MLRVPRSRTATRPWLTGAGARAQDFEKAGALRDREMELKSQIGAITAGAKEGEAAEQEAGEGSGPLVTDQDIANIVAQWTGIPIEKVRVWGFRATLKAAGDRPGHRQHRGAVDRHPHREGASLKVLCLVCKGAGCGVRVCGGVGWVAAAEVAHWRHCLVSQPRSCLFWHRRLSCLSVGGEHHYMAN